MSGPARPSRDSLNPTEIKPYASPEVLSRSCGNSLKRNATSINSRPVSKTLDIETCQHVKAFHGGDN
jgi:hypothetical protein